MKSRMLLEIGENNPDEVKNASGDQTRLILELTNEEIDIMSLNTNEPNDEKIVKRYLKFEILKIIIL